MRNEPARGDRVPTARPYSRALRDKQTALTRGRIVAAAKGLFIANGYLGTTLAAVARDAQVSVQTVYNVVGGKPTLLKAVYDVALAGDEEPIPLSERPEIRALAAVPDARTCLALFAALTRDIGERLHPLLPIVLAQTASGDPDLAGFAETIERERAIGTAMTAGHVHDRFGLRPGLSADDAAAILWTLTSPDVAQRLVFRREWGWDRFQEWLGTAMADALVGPA
jgi:AcrR family transcriptional regulator